jgi:hypothetical protein
MVIFCGNLPQYFNPRNSWVKITNLPRYCFITLAPGLLVSQRLALPYFSFAFQFQFPYRPINSNLVCLCIGLQKIFTTILEIVKD